MGTSAPKPPKKRTYAKEKGEGLETNIVDMPTNNLHREPSAVLKDMGFKVPADFRKSFRAAANEMDISYVEYLRKIHDFYQKHQLRDAN